MLELLIITLLFGGICFGVLVVSAYLMYKFSTEEYRKNFLTINVQGWTMRNLLLNLMISPIYWFIQLGIIVAFSLLLLALIIGVPEYTPLEALLTFFAAGAISLAIAILYSVIIWLLDYKDREPLRLFPSLFLWGCMAAIISFFINTMISATSYIFLPEVLVILLTPTIVAPIIEEGFKGAGVFVLSRSKTFGGIMDGIVYGFIVGMGFAFIEDWVYYTQYAPMQIGLFGWIQFIFLRGILTGTVHGILTATTGIFLGIAKQRNSPRTWLWLAGGLLVAMSLHAAFNGLSIMDTLIFILTGIDFYILVIFMGLLTLGLAIMIWKGLSEQKEVKPEKLKPTNQLIQ